MKHLTKLFYGTGLTLFFARLATSNVFAQSTTGEEKTITDLCKIVVNIFNWLYTFALITGIIFALVAAFTYMTSQGSEEKVDKATKTITYAAVGILVAILAKGLPSIVASVVKVTIGSDFCQ